MCPNHPTAGVTNVATRNGTRLHSSPEQVLHYWFADSRDDPSLCDARSAWWFDGGELLDREIAARFGSDVEAAAAGDLDAWQNEADRCLALVLLLDQFPRNIYRGTAGAFANDDKSVNVARTGVARGHLDPMRPIEASFFLTPFMHSEHMEDQRDGIHLLEAQCERCPPQWRNRLETTLQHAREHAEVIRRFGRFPHRNAILGRTSTPEEQTFLNGGAETWGQ